MFKIRSDIQSLQLSHFTYSYRVTLYNLRPLGFPMWLQHSGQGAQHSGSSNRVPLHFHRINHNGLLRSSILFESCRSFVSAELKNEVDEGHDIIITCNIIYTLRMHRMCVCVFSTTLVINLFSTENIIHNYCALEKVSYGFVMKSERVLVLVGCISVIHVFTLQVILRVTIAIMKLYLERKALSTIWQL